MMNLNRVMLIGNITRDPESRTTPQGTSVTTFSVATNLVWTDANGTKQQKAEFHPVVAWRKLADICSQYVRKGRKVYVEGRLQTRSWDDQSGNKRYRTEIVAENVILLDRPPQETDDGMAKMTAGDEPKEELPPTQDALKDEDIKVEDIPF